MALSAILPDMKKDDVKELVTKFLSTHGFTPIEEDFNRPWGGYFKIKDADFHRFIDEFFSEYQDLKSSMQKLSPKILVVAPQQRLSWQYHHRRAELWKVLHGPIGVIMSETDEQSPMKLFDSSDIVEIDQGTRHRLLGCDNWGVVAEIWKHTDPQRSSDEDDIIRVQDDYGR